VSSVVNIKFCFWELAKK